MSEYSQLKIRIPPKDKSFLEEKAKENFRTINGEVLFRLEQSKFMDIDNMKEIAHEMACLQASALIQDQTIDVHGIVHGFRQPSIKGIKQAFQLFIYMCPRNRDELGMEDIETGVRFYSKNNEYIIRSDNPYPHGAYTINHLSNILEKLYYLPMILPVNTNT